MRREGAEKEEELDGTKRGIWEGRWKRFLGGVDGFIARK